MAVWDSSDLLERWNRITERPSADAMPNAVKYQILDEAQTAVLAKLSGVCGSQMFNPPTAMTSSDGGSTWQYGTDSEGNPIYPLGSASIYQSLDAIPECPLRVGIDYIDEGTQIRIPNNRNWSGQLYWYGILQPPALSATNQPMIQPAHARILIVLEGVRIYAESYDRNPGLADRMSTRIAREEGPLYTQIRKHLQSRYRLNPLVPDFYYPNSAWLRWS